MNTASHKHRPAGPEEADAVARLMRKAWTTSLPFLPVLHTEEEDHRFFRDRVFKTCAVAVIEGETGLVGFIAHRPGWIDHLYVDPACQRRGIGRALVDVAKSAHARLQLWAFQRNIGARAFYQAQGFRLLKTTDGSGNEEREPDALYEWIRL
jgi:putative acetyltransferase